MSISVVSFKPEDGFQLVMETTELSYLKPFVTKERLAAMAKSPSFTVTNELGRILACIGVMEHWAGRAEAWAIFHPDCRQYFLAIHHAVRRFLKITPLKRIEAVVTVGFEEGHRWAQSLGFEMEARCLKAYLPDGNDVSLYARINKEG